MAQANQKDVVYIDVDDEITTIIEKVQNSAGKIVCLVLPKRAATLQSIVNMKLLKRTADDAKKHLVLITTESSLMPLAGAIGVHVAKTLNSKPEIPAAPGGAALDDEEAEELSDADFDKEVAAGAAVGDLAGAGALGAAAADNEPETIELDDEGDEESAAPAAAAAAGVAKAAKKFKPNKKLKVPNFNKFRLGLVLGVLALILLIFGYILAFKVMPKANIAVKTDSMSVNTNEQLTLDPSASSLSEDTNTLPANIQTAQKTLTQQVPATGQQNNGQRASGSITIALANCNHDQVTIPAGTGVSNSGLTFITQSSITLSSVKIGGKCRNSDFTAVSTQSVDVTAAKAGAAYNVPAGSFTVSSGDSYSSSDVSGSSSSAMSGGTDNIVKVVQQSDIDSAKTKLTSQNATGAQGQVQQQLQQNGWYPITATFFSDAPQITTSANVGDQADNVTVTETITSHMFGVHKDDLQQVLEAKIKSQIDPSKQTILDNGLNSAQFKLVSDPSAIANVTLQATATAGPDLNLADLKKQVAGKKSGDIQSLIKSTPGVTDVNVKFSPFWVGSAPSNVNKITITVAKPVSGS